MDNLTVYEQEILECTKKYDDIYGLGIHTLLSTISSLRAEQRCGWCDDYKGRMADLTKERDLLLREVEVLRAEVAKERAWSSRLFDSGFKAEQERDLLLLLNEVETLRAEIKQYKIDLDIADERCRLLKDLAGADDVAYKQVEAERNILRTEVEALRAEEENDDAMKEHLRKKNKKLTKERDLLLREVEALREALGRLGQKRNDLAASAKHEADALAKQRSEK